MGRQWQSEVRRCKGKVIEKSFDSIYFIAQFYDWKSALITRIEANIRIEMCLGIFGKLYAPKKNWEKHEININKTT